MKRFNKRAQAAMEFLMTYGWAILAAVIVIGALGSYFYFNSGGQTSVFVNAPFYGVAAQTNVGEIVLEIQNKGGEDLSNVVVNITSYGCVANSTGFDGADSSPQIITLSCPDATSGTSIAGDIVVTYNRPDSALDLTATGSVSEKVA